MPERVELNPEDRKVVAFLKGCGLWQFGSPKQRFWVNFIILALGFAGVIFLSCHVVTVLLGTLPLLLLVTGAYGVLNVMFENQAKLKENQELQKEIQLLRQEIEKLKSSK